MTSNSPFMTRNSAQTLRILKLTLIILNFRAEFPPGIMKARKRSVKVSLWILKVGAEFLVIKGEFPAYKFYDWEVYTGISVGHTPTSVWGRVCLSVCLSHATSVWGRVCRSVCRSHFHKRMAKSFHVFMSVTITQAYWEEDVSLSVDHTQASVWW